MSSDNNDNSYYLSTIAIISSVCVSVIVVVSTVSIILRYRMRHAVSIEKNCKYCINNHIVLEIEKNTIV